MVANPPQMASTELAQAISEAAEGNGLTIGVAESLTGGLLSNLLAQAPNAAKWFSGGIVAYKSEVKQAILGVTPGPVVTARCAREMVGGAVRLLDVDIGVSVTGVGGPDPEEGQPAGTVWLALWADGEVQVHQRRFEGDPSAVCRQTADEAMRLVLSALRCSQASADGGSGAGVGEPGAPASP